MDTPDSRRDRTGSKTPDWLMKKKEEKVISHTPKKKERPVWKYSLKEGGQVYKIKAPTTDEMISKVEKQLTNPNNWRRYARSPHGGDRNYTQINCFPPFDNLRVAEVFFPNGKVWNSRERKLKKVEDG